MKMDEFYGFSGGASINNLSLPDSIIMLVLLVNHTEAQILANNKRET